MPPVIDESSLERVLALAQLAGMDQLSAGEVQRLLADMQAIIGYVKQVNQIDAAENSPLFNPHPSGLPLRTDQLGQSLEQSEAVSLAEESENNYFVVPKVIPNQ